jgi:hypothetical protein
MFIVLIITGVFMFSTSFQILSHSETLYKRSNKPAVPSNWDTTDHSDSTRKDVPKNGSPSDGEEEEIFQIDYGCENLHYLHGTRDDTEFQNPEIELCRKSILHAP